MLEAVRPHGREINSVLQHSWRTDTTAVKYKDEFVSLGMPLAQCPAYAGRGNAASHSMATHLALWPPRQVRRVTHAVTI